MTELTNVDYQIKCWVEEMRDLHYTAVAIEHIVGEKMHKEYADNLSYSTIMEMLIYLENDFPENVMTDPIKEYGHWQAFLLLEK